MSLHAQTLLCVCICVPGYFGRMPVFFHFLPSYVTRVCRLWLLSLDCITSCSPIFSRPASKLSTRFGLVFICSIMDVSSSMASYSLSISLTILPPTISVSWVGACYAFCSSCYVQHMVLLWKLGLHPSILTQILSTQFFQFSQWSYAHNFLDQKISILTVADATCD